MRWLVLALVCCGVFITSTPSHAQQSRGPYEDIRQLPEGPAGERITQLIETVNSDDPDTVRAFIETALTPEFRDFASMDQHLAIMASVYEQSRGFDFYAVRRYEEETPPTEYVVIVRNRLTEAWQAFMMNIEEDPPHRIMGIQFLPARPPSDLPQEEKLSDEEIIEELEAFLARLDDADAFSGAVLLAKDGKVLFKNAYGLASKRFGVSNRVNTKFNLGSMNKMFTGVAVLQLVERGDLSLDDPLSRFVSEEWLPLEMTEKIKIEHLLTHTSGLSSYFNDKYMESSKALFRELDDYKPLVADSTLAFEPGTDWQYSNTGMFMLGVVIEKVTGQSYFDYVRENIHKPAGMINTDCYEMDKPVPNLAIGYTKEAGEWKNNLYMHVIRGGPAGGGFSTVEDLLAFDIALRSHKLLSPEYTEMVWTAKPELNSPHYGFGFRAGGEPGDRIVGHAGGFPGINGKLDMHLDTGYTVAVLSNYDRAAETVASKIGELIGRLE
jgi:CubicO group peptidase (beta-lactamase class C family)